MKAEIKNVIIDLGVVLVDLTPQVCFDAFRKLGVQQDMSQFATPTHGKGIFSLFEDGTLSLPEFRHELRKLTGLPLTNASIDQAWNSFLGIIPAYKLDFLLILKKQYRLFLLSNTNELHWHKVCKNDFSYHNHEVSDFFEKVYLSYEMHQLKPDIAIFKSLLEDAQIKATETFLIDDAVPNCCAAETLGISTYSPQPNEDWRHLFEKML